MKIFNDIFYNSVNRSGFIEAFNLVDSSKLSDLLGIVTADDIKRYDMYLKSKIGFLTISPILQTIDNETFTTLDEKQEEIIKMFILLRYADLMKIKNVLVDTISVNNGSIKVEDKKTETNSKNSVSSFNSTDMEDDNETNYSNNADNVITEKKTDTETTIKNIHALTDFYKKSMFDTIIDYVKEMFTLQILD